MALSGETNEVCFGCLLDQNLRFLISSASLRNCYNICWSRSCSKRVFATQLNIFCLSFPKLMNYSSFLNSDGDQLLTILLLTKFGLSINILKIITAQINSCSSESRMGSEKQLQMFFLFLLLTMKRQGRQSLQKQSNSSSRKKVEAIYEQQKQVAEAFNIDHFYDHNYLNLEELRSRLSIFKRIFKPPNNNPSVKPESPIRTYQQQSAPKFVRLRGLQNRQKDEEDSNKNEVFDRTISNYSQPHSHRKYNHLQKSTSKWHNKQIKIDPIQTSWESKSKVSYKPDKIDEKTTAIASFRYGRNRKRMKTMTDKEDCSKCSQSSLVKSSEQGGGFEGRIRLGSSGDVARVQNYIQWLWSHYQLLTRVLIGLQGNIREEKNNLVKYREITCSKKFEFLKSIHEVLTKDSTSKHDISFAKRLSRSIVLSRVYENLGISYVCLFICLQLKPNAHLTNCIGYATSSLAFLIKIIWLIHAFEPPLSLNSSTLDILQTIREYERGTFGGQLSRVSELTLRLQQNNEVMSIVQAKLCQAMDHQFQDTVTNLLKKIDLDNKPINEYSHYIFEFLSFHLVTLKMFGSFPAVEIPPAPYFTFFNKKKTLVIEPWGVLFSNKGSSTFVRAHTELFLSQVSKFWNIVYWSTLMPKDIDDLLQKLPSGRCLYRYHCLCTADYFIKPLDRIGCDVHNTMVIDISENNFHYNKDIGLELPWKAQRKDSKLADILELLHPALMNEQLRMSDMVSQLKSKLNGSHKKKSPSKRRPRGQKYQWDDGQLYPKRLVTHR